MLRQMAPGRNDNERIRNLMGTVTDQGIGGLKTKQVVIKVTDLEPGTRVRKRENAPISGSINSVAFFFPSGPDQKVDVALDVEGERVTPGSGDFLALNDVSITLPVREDVERGDQIDLIVRNRDPQEAHTVQIIANVVQNLSAQSGETLDVA